MIKTEIKIKINDLLDFNSQGFSYLPVDRDKRIYVPQDKSVYLKYGFKGSVQKGEKSYSIKKGTNNIVYIVYLKITHDENVKVENIKVEATGNKINELIYDDSSILLDYIIRIIEVSPDSTVKVEFDVAGKHYAVIYHKDDVEILEL